MARLFVFVLLLAFSISSYAMREQWIGCKGKLLCGSKPASGVRVALWDEDSGKLLLLSVV